MKEKQKCFCLSYHASRFTLMVFRKETKIYRKKKGKNYFKLKIMRKSILLDCFVSLSWFYSANSRMYLYSTVSLLPRK